MLLQRTKEEVIMKAKTKDGKIIPLASTISVLSGYGSVKWGDIIEFIPEANDIAMGWEDILVREQKNK